MNRGWPSFNLPSISSAIDQIDEMSTLWGDQGTCAYFYYVPVVETICAVVWIVFIAISGHRGEQVAKS